MVERFSGRLSVIIRTLPGRERFLDDCLFILSNQTYPDIEPIIVVQTLPGRDHLTDQITTRWRVHFNGLQIISHESSGDARARALNLGMAAARGRYIAFLDDDDKVFPDHYQTLIESIRNTGRLWAYADTVQTLIDSQGRVRRRWMPYQRPRFSYSDLLSGNFIPIHAYVFDRERAPDIWFDEDLCRLEDYDFLVRLAWNARPVYIQKPGCAYCIRDDSTNTVALHSIEARRLWQHMETIVRQKIARMPLPISTRISLTMRRYGIRVVRAGIVRVVAYVAHNKVARALYRTARVMLAPVKRQLSPDG